MTKVCHMTSAHKSQDVRILKKQCTSLAKAGYTTYLVAQGESYTENGVQVIGIGSIQGGRLKRMTQATKLVYKKALELDCDIYQIHDPELLPYALKLKRKGKKVKRVIFDSHENIIDSIREKEYIPMLFRSFISFICNMYLKYVVNKLDAVITVSPHIVEYYKKCHDNVCMITNYPFLLENKSLSKKSNSLIFAGGISKQWNHENIVQSIQNIDIRYELYGTVSDAYLQLLKDLDKNNKVRYHGTIPHNQVHETLQKSLIGIALLEYNFNAGGKLGTIGNTKVFEFMMASLPIICTNFTLWKDFVEKYDCGILVDPDNLEEITKAIQYLLDNPKEAKKMGDNGRTAIKEEFNWEIEEKKLLQLYKELEQ